MLIDLGEDWETPAEAERPHWMRGLRPVAALIALFPALALTSAAPKPVPLLTVAASVALGTSEELIEFSGKEIIVRDGRVVTVYDRDGRERWHSTLTSVNDVFFRVDVHNGRVLAMAQRMQVPRTVAFDLATGRRVWEFDGWADTLDDLILVNSLEGEDFAVYDATSLNLRWSVRSLAAHAADNDSRTLVAIERDGTIIERALASGSVVRSGHVDLPAGLENIGLGLTSDLITLYYQRASEDAAPQMLSFDRRTFAPRPGVEPRFSDRVRFDCGPVVCESGDDHGQVLVLDPASGKLLWQAAYGAGLMFTPAGLFAFPQFDSSTTMPIELLDPLSGKKLATLEGWQPIPLEGRFSAAPVVMRQVQVTGADGQTFVGGFDKSGFLVLGSVNHVIYHCRYADWALACVTADRQLLVIEINSEHWRM